MRVGLVLLLLNLSHATPLLRPKPVLKQQRESSAGPLSRATFSWLNPTLRLGNERPLDEADLPPLLPCDASDASFATFQSRWDASDGERGENAFASALFRSFGREFARAGVIKLASDGCLLAFPLLLRAVVAKLEVGAGLRAGRGPTLALLAASSVQAFLLRHYFASLFRLAPRVRAAVVGACYRKLLRLSPASRLAASSGEVTNLMGPDAQRIADLVPYLHALWFSPLQVLAGLAILHREVGSSLLPGLVLIAAMLGSNKAIAARTYRRQQELLRQRDARTRLVRELLGCIKAIKLHAWETAFEARLGAARAAELATASSLIRLRSLQAAVFSATPALVSASILAMHTLRGHPLSLRTALTVLSAVGLLRSPLLFLPLVLNSAQEARASLGRMQRFLGLPEATPLSSEGLEELGTRGVGLALRGVELGWPSAAEVARGPLERDGHVAHAAHAGGEAEAECHAAVTAEVAAEVELAAGGERPWSGDETGSTAASDEASGRSGGAAAEREGFRLRHLQLSAGAGELLAVVGPVGCGKTTLLSALTGELSPLRGVVSLRGSVAYAAQRPFILSDTVRANILFGRPLDEARYAAVLDACALRPDLAALPNGDLTHIGDKGLSLSGGQRSRVSLARAAYSGAEIVIMDDPLAAVDGGTAHHLMSQLLGPEGMLGDRLRILVTNQLGLLSEARARVLVLDGGAVVEQGTFAQLAAAGGTFQRLLSIGRREVEVEVEVEVAPPATEGAARDATAAATKEEAAEAEEVVTPPLPSAGLLGGEQLGAALGQVGGSEGGEGSDDERQVGRVSGAVLRAWLDAAGGARILPLLLLPTLLTEAASVGSSWWMTRWASAAEGAARFYLSGYVAISLSSALLVTLRSRTVLRVGLAAGSRLHDGLLATLMRAPQRFFDVTPSGRLLNRFSRELLIVDNTLPSALQTYGSTLCAVGSALAVVCASSPLFLLAVVPIAAAYLAFQRFYMASARELRRIESGTRAPLLSHISESIDGLSTIQAYGAAPRFVQAADAKQDRNLRATRVSSLLNCWLGLRLELLGSVIASVATLLAFRKNGRLFVAGASATAGTAALSVSLSMQVVQTLNWSVRQACDLEAHLVAVERLGSYRGLPPEPGLDLPPEPGLDLPGDGAADGIAGAGQARALEQGAGGRRGKLELSGVGLRYRDGLPPVLSEVSATVQPGERVGVVGRTGSGKSSLFAALTRLVAPPLRSGRIFIDGRDISALPLRAYRSSLTVIPQEPVLFEGTVRFNLDPLRRHEDEELWAALRQVQLAAVVRSLDEQVAEDGANFSAGQQQLLVIGRALLSRPALLLMDEATSSVDAETDALIQRTVRACFGQATVLTIAHRLETVLDADKILVLDEGRCVEFGPPALLLERRGAFHRMVEERGPGGGRA